MPPISNALIAKSTANVSNSVKDARAVIGHCLRMSDKPEHFLREWRLFREMSQGQLAEKVDTATAVISLLENGKRALSDKWLRKLAVALETRPGHILDVDPNDLDNDIVEIWASIAKRDREQARRVLRSFVKTGTDDSK